MSLWGCIFVWRIIQKVLKCGNMVVVIDEKSWLKLCFMTTTMTTTMLCAKYWYLASVCFVNTLFINTFYIESVSNHCVHSASTLTWTLCHNKCHFNSHGYDCWFSTGGSLWLPIWFSIYSEVPHCCTHLCKQTSQASLNTDSQPFTVYSLKGAL